MPVVMLRAPLKDLAGGEAIASAAKEP